MDHAKPEVRSETARPSRARKASVGELELAATVLAQLEDCLATLDELSWTLPAAHLSLAVDSLRRQLTLTRVEDPDRADMLRR